MARDDTPLDQETFDRVLAEEVGKGADRRVAEGGARAAALRAACRPARTAETPRPRRPLVMVGTRTRRGARRRLPAPAAGVPAATAPAAAAAPAAVGPAAAAAAGTRRDRDAHRARAPGAAPTGNVPEPKRGRPRSTACWHWSPEGIQRVEREQGDRINVWPHLLIEEFVAMMIVLAALTIFSTFVNAPLRELANPNLTPNPSKAPWYFLGLQELLRYFHPMVAGVLFAPTLVLLALAVAPFVDRTRAPSPAIERSRSRCSRCS